MNDLIIQNMQLAVDALAGAEHATSKVAACVFHPETGQCTAAPSRRPKCCKNHFAWDARIGASSQFIHGELAALIDFNAPWQGAHLCVTDPFCPNCAKMMAEAGLRNVYIDHKGFQKDFIARNGDEFKNMSMLVAEKAGMNVYEVNRKAGSVLSILTHATPTRAASSGVEFYDIDAHTTLKGVMRDFQKRLGTRETWTTAFVREANGHDRGILVFEALPPGFTPDDFMVRGHADTGKYRFPIDPLTRLLITTRRMGMALTEGFIGSSHVPSSRALVNMLGFGRNSLTLMSSLPEHDPLGHTALTQLRNYKLIEMELLS